MLAPKERLDLINEIKASFNANQLDAFLQTAFEPTGLAAFAQANLTWPLQVIQFVRQLESQQTLMSFLRLLADHPGPVGGLPGPRPSLRALAAKLLEGVWPPSPERRPCFVAGRLFINRDRLWSQVQDFAEDSEGAKRILLIEGEPGTGKSHSGHLIGQWARNRARYIPIDLAKSTAPEASITELTLPIATRLRLALNQNFDDLAQESRDVLRAGELLVAALQELERVSREGGEPEPWWIAVDGLNATRVGPPVIDLIIRLVQAIDQSECNNLWLVLIGLKPELLTGGLPEIVRRDRSMLPSIDHVRAWLCQLGKLHNRTLQDPDMAPAMSSLTSALNGNAARDHGFWPPFLAALSLARSQLGLDQA